MQDTLTFGTLPPDEVLKRALKFEQSKQTIQAFQKLTLGTAQTVSQSNSQIKIKQQPILAGGNRNQPNKRFNLERNRRKQPDGRAPAKYNIDNRKRCNRCGKPFTEGHLKNCAAMGKQSKNCNETNHFARMSRSQQVNELTVNTESSEEECIFIQIFFFQYVQCRLSCFRS